jgi:hypothetical protein
MDHHKFSSRKNGRSITNHYGKSEKPHKIKREWSPDSELEFKNTYPKHPEVQAYKKMMKTNLQAQQHDIEETMRLKYDSLLKQIDAEIEDTRNKLEHFHRMNDAIHEKSTKRLKRISDIISGEKE